MKFRPTCPRCGGRGRCAMHSARSCHQTIPDASGGLALISVAKSPSRQRRFVNGKGCSRQKSESVPAARLRGGSPDPGAFINTDLGRSHGPPGNGVRIASSAGTPGLA